MLPRTPACRSPGSSPRPITDPGTLAAVLVGVFLLLVGAVLLVAGAELVGENVSAAANRLGVLVVAIGLLLAGAEPEEAVTAVIASLEGRPVLAAGDAIGANLVILALALGLAALFRPLPVDRRVRSYAAGAALAGGLALAALVDGSLSRVEGLLLVAAYAVGVGVVWRRERVPPVIGELADIQEAAPARRERVAVAFALGGVALMVLGGWAAVRGAERLVATLRLTDSGVGLTLLALATSAEMLALVFAAARHQVGEVAIAGLVGAAAYNATVSIGLAAVARPLDLSGGTPVVVTAAVTAVLPLGVLLLGRGVKVSRAVGVALVTGYLAAVPLLLG